MAEGIITLTKTGGGSLAGRILWSSTGKGIQENASVVTAQLQIYKPNGYTTMGTWTGSLTVGAKNVSISYYSHVGSDWVTIATVETTVGHNPDGTGTCYLYAKLSGPGGTTVEGTSVSGSATVTLDTIDRYAYLVSAPDFDDEQNPTITYKNPLGSSVTKLEACISLDGESVDVGYKEVGKTDTSFQFSLSESERNVLRSATVGANSRYVTFKLRTTIEGKNVFSTLRRTFSIKDPEPVVTPTVEDVNSTTVALTGSKNKLIRFHSSASVTIGAEAVKQATIESTKVTCGNQTLLEDGVIENPESGTFHFTVVDSRKNTKKVFLGKGFVKYVHLTCSSTSDIPDGEGKMTVSASGNYFNGSFGAKDNTLNVYYRYKKKGGSYGDWIGMGVSVEGNSYTASQSVTGLDYKYAYVFQTMATDALETTYSAEWTVKATPVFDWSEQDFRFRVPIDMSGNRISALGNPSENTDAVPLGYMNNLGLGAGGKHTVDLNEEKTCGWVSFSSECANAPFKYGVAMVMKRYDTQIVQVAFNPYVSPGKGEICVRSYENEWLPWEYLNPPMTAGTEYRTLQRHNGEPVYTMLVNCGTLPNNSTKTVNHSFSASHVIAWDGILYSSSESQNLAGNTDATIKVTNAKTTVTTKKSMSAYSFAMIYRYTK